MHVQSCCFANQTYSFFDVLVAVRVVVAKAPYYLTLHVGSTSAHPYGNPLKSVSRFLLGNCISNYQKYRKHYQKYSLMVNPLSK